MTGPGLETDVPLPDYDPTDALPTDEVLKAMGVQEGRAIRERNRAWREKEAETPHLRAGEPKARRFRVLSDEEIENMPPPEFLIDGILTKGGLSVLVAPPDSYKSFLAIDWASCVASGLPWGDKAVKRGPVLYIAAEGSAGLGVRRKAWKLYRHVSGDVGVRWITEPVALTEEADLLTFLLTVEEEMTDPPALVVIDTLARCFAAGDENSTKDMNAFIGAVDRIRMRWGAAVLVLHHMNAGGERERGNTALRGACDTMIFMKRDGEQVTLSCEKQKDAAPFEKVRMELTPISGSCVLKVTATKAWQLTAEEITPVQLETLALLSSHFLDSGATTSEWLRVSRLPERTFYRHRKLLVDNGFVARPANPSGGRYTLTDAGREALTANCHVTAK